MRYEWLDKRIDEIIERYEAGQSIREIAEVFDVSTKPIHTRLQEHDVAMRNGGPRYIRLADRRTELLEAYEQGCTVQTLADRYRTSVATIQCHLEAAGCDCDPPPRTADVDLTPAHHAVIQGELLGDGCLHRPDPDTCFVQLSTTTRAHACRLIETLPDGLFPSGQPNSFTRGHTLADGEYTLWTVSSRPQARFNEMYDDWYQIRSGTNRKIVPADYGLTRTALLHWYWGDGSCSIRESGAPRVSLATHGFPEASVVRLQSEVDRLGYDNYAVEQSDVDDGSGLFLRFRDYDARTFLDDFRRLNTLPQYDHKFPVPVPDAE